ncbi:MAG TPA: hypothetical protein VK419_01940 [Bryobacteraceae bacterium]|nr:hypothetical protein [Bryobacteraceae bacterium]
MLARLVILCCFAVAASGANFRLYLKDGSYQMTNEYQVLQDRVRFYSIERSEWEEIPLEMIDLDRTKKEIAERDAAAKEEAKASAEEDNAEREAVKEIERVPPDPGAYYSHADKLETLRIAESKLVGNKRRTALKILSPLPLVTGKQTLELDGESAELRVAEARPEFYFRLADEESFAIIKLTRKKGSRVVENIDVAPVTNEIIEHRDEIPTFKKQDGYLLYKIWPENDLEPGEYALVEYTELKRNPQVWDFGVGAASSGDSSKKGK